MMNVTYNIVRCNNLKASFLVKSLLKNRCIASFHIDARTSCLNVVRSAKLTRREISSISPLLVRFASTSPVTNGTHNILDPIPEPPQPLPETSASEIVGEPSFESIGLGGWTPIGFVQNCLEYLHVSLDLPWWTVIMIGTVVVRSLLFPVVIIAQRNAAKMHNHMPEIQKIQLKMTDARERGDRFDTARYGQELMTYMNKNGVNPFKNMLVPVCQAPVFISFFIALRRMASHPVESMKTGGLFWFSDLTIPDQFFLLPIITSATLAVTIEVGTDTARLNSANLGMMKYVLRAMPVLIFPFTINFSSAILVYWCSTNFISLLQVLVLRIPRVRSYFDIDALKTFDKSKAPIKEKGFKKGLTDAWTNLKLTRELEEREKVDEYNFKRAGRGAVVKTFKYDPTKPQPVMEAKKRD